MTDEATAILGYTVVLTRGTHDVSCATGEAILAAVEANTARTMTVDLDLLGDGFVRRVMLVLAHVMAVIPRSPGDSVANLGPNVMAFRTRSDDGP